MSKFFPPFTLGLFLGAALLFVTKDLVFTSVRPEVTQTKDIAGHFSGIASYYGIEFHGKCMANGLFYDKEAMTAAHPTLPLGTVIQVTNLGRSVTVTITDRGPYVEGRILDLSEAAARSIGVIENGTATVEVEIEHLPLSSETYHHENPACLVTNTQVARSRNARHARVT